MRVHGAAFGLLLAAGLAAAADPSVPASLPVSRAEKPEWTVRLEAPGPAGHGAGVVHLAARAGYHVNLDYPIAFRPTAAGAPEKLALTPASKEACQGRPAETCAITLDLPASAAGPARAPTAGTLAFSVCSADRCLIEKVALTAAGAGAT